MTTSILTRSRALALAWPIMLAQVATATTGIVDTAVMGRYGTAAELAAVGLAAVVFNFLYWGFGFLRMATTGLTAQADGAGDTGETNAILKRALLLGGGLGLLILITFPLVSHFSLALFQADAPVEAEAAAYFWGRIWGAPAALMGFAITGWLIGTGRTRALLAVQIGMNAVNGGLDFLFVAVFDWGPAGIGVGTAMAEWAALALGLVIVRSALGPGGQLLDRAKLTSLISANRDIMIRTLALLFSFAWFVNSGAQQGIAVMAGNQVLLQFIAVSAFVLDAFAFVAEKEAGAAYGARDRARLVRAMRVTSELALACGALFSLVFWLGGGAVIHAFILDPAARDAALAYLPWCAAVPFIGVAAWQLDGLFLGTTQGPAVRNAGMLAMAAYLVTDLTLAPAFNNAGVWTAFLLSYVYRAGALALYWPRLMGRLAPETARG
ncbi:putative DNA-damage-inducible protein F [Hyphomonas neptunium ATCC 15444]|uniref:Putative DNA-damage-inducible protein F n=2 Tax=Hyphomonas TaxID=85 RepID=Q0BYJ3_HYPNA|nr:MULTISPECIES: MATE family efflux transporter [Hyphomonas]ABI78199.1 putative DNA-damage-inducible protein F [Hyphomonas neptunium ATCC 15444]KCZ87078.1 putative DNA-damage-inducible protein F [Hyphomonas hirschiana VP5]